MLPLVLLTNGNMQDESDRRILHQFKATYPAPVVHLTAGCSNGDCGVQGNKVATLVTDLLSGLSARTFVGTGRSTFSIYIIKLRSKLGQLYGGDAPFGINQEPITIPEQVAAHANGQTTCWNSFTQWKGLFLKTDALNWCDQTACTDEM